MKQWRARSRGRRLAALTRVTPTSEPPSHFDPDSLAGLDEPVRRWFTHAIAPGSPLAQRYRVEMSGRIKADLWLPFSAQEEIDGRSFRWRARVGLGPLTLLRIDDGYARGRGRTEGRLFGRRRLFASDDDDTARSAAARTALESVVFAPPTVLPARGVAWRAEDERTIVGRFDLPPERPEVQVEIDDRGAMRSAVAARWGPGDRGEHAYVPCGGEIHAEGRFGGLVVPSRVTVSWRFGTPRQAPFFKADVRLVAPAPDP